MDCVKAITLPEFSHLIRWIEEAHASQIQDWIEEYAMTQGSLTPLQWLNSLGRSWDADTFNSAIINGHLHILPWLKSQGCPWNKATGFHAACGGHLDVLQWLKQHGYHWHVDLCEGAAQGGHLHILQWLRNEGCPWDEKTCVGSVLEGGHLDVLQWARQNGCPWDESVCHYAARGGHLDILQWAVQQGCPFKAQHLFQVALCNDEWEVAQWLAMHHQPVEMNNGAVGTWRPWHAYQAQQWLTRRYACTVATRATVWMNAVEEALKALQLRLCPDLAELVARYC